jgi:hypothetical protein
MTLLSIALAYLLAGIGQVTADLTAPLLKKPPWAIRPTIGMIVLQVATWPFGYFARETFAAVGTNQIAKATAFVLLEITSYLAVLSTIIWVCIAAAVYVSESTAVRIAATAILLIICSRIIIPRLVSPLLTVLMLPLKLIVALPLDLLFPAKKAPDKSSNILKSAAEAAPPSEPASPQSPEFGPRGEQEREGITPGPPTTVKEMLIAQTPPWDRVPHAFVELVVDVLGDTGLLDVFILHSLEHGLVARYAIICKGDFYEPVIRAQISQILCQTGNRALPVLAKAVAKGQRDKVVKALMLGGDCFEAAIAFERKQVGGYIGLAQAYAMIGRRDKSHEYAERGLSLLAEVRDDPGSKAIASGASSIIPPDIHDQAERLLRTCLEY